MNTKGRAYLRPERTPLKFLNDSAQKHITGLNKTQDFKILLEIQSSYNKKNHIETNQ